MIGRTVFIMYLVPFFTSSDVMVARLVCRLWNDVLSTRKYRAPLGICRFDTRDTMSEVSSSPSHPVQGLVVSASVTVVIQICTYVALTETSRRMGFFGSDRAIQIILTGTIA
eukprot:PhF_6_TR40459/c1_g1_i7/m.60452